MFRKIFMSKEKPTAQAMAEFALVLPILLLVVYGLLETGRLLFIFATVNTASRQAVRYGSAIGLVDTNNDGTPDTPRYLDCNGILAAANSVAFISRFTDVNITYDRGIDASGNPVPLKATPSWTLDPNPATANHNTCTVMAALTDDPIENGDRISVYVAADFYPVIPFVPLGPFSVSNGNPIDSTASRTIIGEISINVTAVPADLPGAGGGTNALELTITPDPDTYSDVGQEITYTYTLTNSGTNVLTAPYTITDSNSAINISCAGAASSLAEGDSTTCTGTYSITQHDLDVGSMTNTATATSGSTTSPSASATITAIQNREISLEKTVSPLVALELDDRVDYTYTITNTGNVTLIGTFTVADNKILNVSCPGSMSTLAPASSTTCTASYTITSSDLKAGSVTNYAIATLNKNQDDQVDSNVASASVITAALSLESITPDPNPVNGSGQVVTYTYRLHNVGIADITSLGISDDTATFDSCVSTSLAPGATTTCTGTYTTALADVDAGSVDNTARATGVVSGQNIASNELSASVIVIATPGLSLSVTASPNPAQETQNVTYTYTLTNTGNTTLKSLSVSDPRIGSVSCAGVPSSLSPTQQATCTAVYQVTVNDVADGSVIDSATANATTASSQSVSSSPASFTLITYNAPRLTLEITSNPTSVSTVGETINLTYWLRNTGNVDLMPPYTFTDPDGKVFNITCFGTTSILPIGGYKTCTASYIVSSGDIAAGFVEFNGAATAQNGTQTLTSQSTLSVPINVASACNPTATGLKLPSPFGFTIFNYNSNTQVTIKRINVYFNDNSQKISKLLLYNQEIWSSIEGWNTSPGIFNTFSNSVVIAVNSSAPFQVQFKDPYIANNTEKVIVEFAESGCPTLTVVP